MADCFPYRAVGTGAVVFDWLLPLSCRQHWCRGVGLAASFTMLSALVPWCRAGCFLCHAVGIGVVVYGWLLPLPCCRHWCRGVRLIPLPCCRHWCRGVRLIPLPCCRHLYRGVYLAASFAVVFDWLLPLPCCRHWCRGVRLAASFAMLSALMSCCMADCFLYRAVGTGTVL